MLLIYRSDLILWPRGIHFGDVTVLAHEGNKTLGISRWANSLAKSLWIVTKDSNTYSQ